VRHEVISLGPLRLWASFRAGLLLSVHVRPTEGPWDLAIATTPQGLSAWTRSWLEGANPPLPGPLVCLGPNLRARAFAEALLRIPRGQTRTYREVSLEVFGKPAPRALGRLCAANKLLLVLPCHRVVRSDGTLGGYAGGEDIKRSLLFMEATRPSGWG
jgi:O-6-methylguanine DNA methyltransferase